MGRKNDVIPIKPENGLPLIDCHCHFPSDELPRSMRKSNQSITKLNEDQYHDFFTNHKGQFIVTSTSIWGVEFCQKFRQTHPNMLLTIGWGAQATTYAKPEEWKIDYPRYYDYLENNTDKYDVIGEIGIDFHHAKTFKKREHQIDIFEEMIQKTKHLGKKYSLHVRNPTQNDRDPHSPNVSYNDRDICNDLILDILETEKIPPSDVMWHCFSGPAEWGKLLGEKGYYISIPSSAYGFNKWRRNIQDVPLDRLLAETDASAQHPYTMGAFNTPSNVEYAIAAIAYVNEMAQIDVANQVLKNAKVFFDIN